MKCSTYKKCMAKCVRNVVLQPKWMATKCMICSIYHQCMAFKCCESLLRYIAVGCSTRVRRVSSMRCRAMKCYKYTSQGQWKVRNIMLQYIAWMQWNECQGKAVIFSGKENLCISAEQWRCNEVLLGHESFSRGQWNLLPRCVKQARPHFGEKYGQMMFFIER